MYCRFAITICYKLEVILDYESKGKKNVNL